MCRCTEEEVFKYLKELEALGVARMVENEWLRVDTRNVDAVARPPSRGRFDFRHCHVLHLNYSTHLLTIFDLLGAGDQPTIAIISCLFIEKQAVDALIDDRTTVHKVSFAQ